MGMPSKAVGHIVRCNEVGRAVLPISPQGPFWQNARELVPCGAALTTAAQCSAFSKVADELTVLWSLVHCMLQGNGACHANCFHLSGLRDSILYATLALQLLSLRVG